MTERDRSAVLRPPTALAGRGEVDAALGVAGAAGRFAEDDLLAIVRHRAAGHRGMGEVRPMSNPDHTPEQTPPGLPPARWILLDRTTATQAAVLDRLERRSRS